MAMPMRSAMSRSGMTAGWSAGSLPAHMAIGWGARSPSATFPRRSRARAPGSRSRSSASGGLRCGSPFARMIPPACACAPEMKLREIRTFVVGNPPPHDGGRYFVFTKLTTADGIEGVGEAYGVPFEPHLVARLLDDVFGRYLEGEDPHDIERIWRRVYSSGYSQHPDLTLMGVLSALEMACWDIIGKAAGQPVYKLLGGRVHERLRTYTYIYARDRKSVV